MGWLSQAGVRLLSGRGVHLPANFLSSHSQRIHLLSRSVPVIHPARWAQKRNSGGVCRAQAEDFRSAFVLISFTIKPIGSLQLSGSIIICTELEDYGVQEVRLLLGLCRSLRSDVWALGRS